MKTLITKFIAVVVFFSVLSCQESNPKNAKHLEDGQKKKGKRENSGSILSDSNYVSKKGSDDRDMKQSMAIIEKKYGEQWDFCRCVILNDSIDKAIKAGNSNERLLARWDFVDKKCQAFRIQDPHRTPEERERHKLKVQQCLKNGLKIQAIH